MTRILIASILLMFFSSCYCKKNTITETSQIPPVDEQAKAIEKEEDNKVENLVTVNFTSRGEGIDHAAREEFEELLRRYSDEFPELISYKVSNWGREGELEFCIRFDYDDPNLREQFLNEVSSIADGSERVFLKTGVACRK
jgi:hypothetical protein